MKILYLHGLQGSLTDEKRAVLSPYGEVIAPALDYYSDNRMIATLKQQYQQQGIEVIIGSSMGGFTSYYLSLLLNTSCLAFNPALPKRSVDQQIPEITVARTKYLQVVLGSKDETVPAAGNLEFLNKNMPAEVNSRIHILHQLEHRITLDVFQQEVDIFFRNS